MSIFWLRGWSKAQNRSKTVRVKDLFPEFSPQSEAVMASLASRPLDWQRWRIEEFALLKLSWKMNEEMPELLAHNSRYLYSVLLPGDSNKPTWSGLLTKPQRGASSIVQELFERKPSVSSYSDLLKWLRGRRAQAEGSSYAQVLEDILQLGTLMGMGAQDCLIVDLMDFLSKDSQGNGLEASCCERIEYKRGESSLFKGSAEDFLAWCCL